MKSPLYFDTHTSYHPFKDSVEILKRAPAAEYRNRYFSQTLKNLNSIENDIKELFGGADYQLLFKQELDSIDELLVFLHYSQQVFITGKINIHLFSNRSGSSIWNRYEPFGVKTDTISPNEKGLVTPEILNRHLLPRSSLVSIPWADPITGIIQPVEALAKVCKEKGVFFHTDITHMVGKKYFTLADIGADYVTFDSMGFYGASPLCALFFPKEINVAKTSFIRPVADMLSLKSTLLSVGERIDDLHLEGARLSKLLEKKLMQQIPGIKNLFKDVETLPNVSCLEFPHVQKETLLYYLSLEQVYPSIMENEITSFYRSNRALSFTVPYFYEEKDILEAAARIAHAYQMALGISRGLGSES